MCRHETTFIECACGKTCNHKVNMHYCWDASEDNGSCKEGLSVSERSQRGECEECRKAREENELEGKKKRNGVPPKTKKSVTFKEDVEEIPADDLGCHA